MPAKVNSKKTTDKVDAKPAEPVVAPAPVATPPEPEKKKGGKKEKKPEPVPEVVEEVKEDKPAEPVAEAEAEAEAEPVAEEPAKKPKKAVAKGKKKVVTKGKKVAAKGKTGKKKAKVAKKTAGEEVKLSDEKRPRYFKLIFGGQQKGRFSGNKPKQAANKALTSIIKEKEKNGEEVINVEIKFSLKECTRWNKKKCRKGDNEKIEKIYNYLGKRELLDEQVPVDHIQKETDANVLKGGKVTKEVKLDNGDTKYYLDVKEKDAEGKEEEKHVIVKKINIKDKKTKKPTGAVKYAVINEITYKYTNKVQKFKAEQPAK